MEESSKINLELNKGSKKLSLPLFQGGYMKWIMCLLGIHKFRSLKIYSPKTGKWFGFKKCSVCKRVEYN